MGFLAGSTTFERFRVTKDPTSAFGDDHLEALIKHQIGKPESNLYEQPNVGFTAGAHLLDTDFDFAKNVIGDAMHFGIRIDSVSVPAPIKKAWLQIELAGMMKDNEGGKPTKTQRQEAKDAVDERCAAEAKKGNFKRMSETSVLWDSTTETIYLGSTSEKTNDTCLELLEKAFGLEFSRVTSGKLALEVAEANDQNAELFGITPAQFIPEDGSAEITWWNGMKDNYDYLGNEFMLWLWWKWDTGTEMFELSDTSEVSGMFARSLSLDCPRGEHGKESISSESPVKLPEAAMAIRMGKLPRKAGLTLIRDDEQFDLTLQAEMFSVGSAKISQLGDKMEIRESLDRIESIRQLSETLDLLFENFCLQRIGKSWKGDLKKISAWLENENSIRRRRSVAA